MRWTRHKIISHPDSRLERGGYNVCVVRLLVNKTLRSRMTFRRLLCT